jgi:hypothetical protein
MCNTGRAARGWPVSRPPDRDSATRAVAERPPTGGVAPFQPPRKRPVLLVVSAVLLVIWIGFLVAMALR